MALLRSLFKFCSRFFFLFILDLNDRTLYELLEKLQISTLKDTSKKIVGYVKCNKVIEFTKLTETSSKQIAGNILRDLVD